MPGILPMKVIKVGTNAQTRIAQACDRCRSKKIRCDGIRPCCSQCSNVGFECKTSDKLSRRAFPRGYTESLEERVRGLEAEVRELKDLLDEKDEKIDLLSRIHSQSSHPIQLSSPRRPSAISATSSKSATAEPAEKDEVFKVQQSPYLLDANGSDSYFAGTSSTRTFVEAFKHKVQECGRSTDDIDTELLLAGNATSSPADSPMSPGDATVFSPPPRIVSDQLINVFFQEWAPLFPVLHRPLFLTLYERYCSEPEDVTDKAELAQLNLVFAIAAVSSSSKTVAELKSFERQWKAAVDEILTESSMSTLQALILAQIYCVQQGDLTRLLTYKGLSTSLSARFGLHQSQKRFALGTLTCETRKKVFWTLYTLDCFTAVVLGLPKQLKDDDVNCEYPVDADDEYVTERGFQPTLPGESTKLSSALALFRAARILSKVLEDVFPAKTSYELSMKKLTDLQDELDAWHTSLAPHLRLHFAQDKPSTGTISSRSPLLSLTYHYIRALINRPVICASVGDQSSSSMMTHASSCKHIIQILQLLGERGMSFSYCLNRNELLVLCGFGLLSQGLGLDQSSKILRDNQKMLRITISMLEKGRAPCSQEFSRVANNFLPTSVSPTARITASPPKATVPQMSRHNSDSTVPITINPHPSLPASTRKQLKAIASRFTSNTKTPKLDASTEHRRATIPNIGLVHDAKRSRESGANVPSSSTHGYSPASVSRSEPARSPLNSYSRSPANRPSAPPAPGRPMNKPSPSTKALNLDYLSFGPDSDATPVSRHKSSSSAKSMPQPTDWEKLLGSLDNGATNIYDACYGGQPVEALLDSPAAQTAHSTASKSPVARNSTDDALSGDPDLWAQLYHTDTNTTLDSALTLSSGGQAESVLSLSSAEDLCGGRNSGEDFVVDSEWLSIASTGLEHKTSNATLSGSVGSFRGIVMPATVDGDDGLSFGSPWESGLTL